MSVGYLADSFDLLNVRDLDLIAQARAHCSELVLGVYTDEYAEELSGRRPVVPLAERIAVLQHVRGVATVVVHDPELGQPDPDMVTLVVDGGHVAPAEGDVLITPRRSSESAVLRNALRPAGRKAPGEAVA